MPFAGYENFEACVIDQKSKGYSANSARKICGKLQAEAEGKASRKSFRFFDAMTTDGVERSEANGPPTAFRIWKKGSNVTDHGPTVFSERSAALLLAEQAKRGNRYSIDVDHMSLDKDAPIENHAAVGWFSLDVRGGDLWATNIEWVNDNIRAGLTKGAWKYMSPAYDVDEDGEVTSFLNLSLTANPATHATTALASRGARKGTSQMDEEKKAKKAMTWGDIKAALDGDDENAKAAAYATIAAAFPEHEEPDGDEGKKDAEEAPEKKDSADDADKKDAEDEPEKKDSALAAALAEVNRLATRVSDLEKKSASDERKTLLASRPDFAPELVKILSSSPLGVVRDAVKSLPKVAVMKTTETVQATRGSTNSDDRSPRLPPEERKQLRQRMGLESTASEIRWDERKASRVFPAVLAKKEAK